MALFSKSRRKKRQADRSFKKQSGTVIGSSTTGKGQLSVKTKVSDTLSIAEGFNRINESAAKAGGKPIPLAGEGFHTTEKSGRRTFRDGKVIRDEDAGIDRRPESTKTNERIKDALERRLSPTEESQTEINSRLNEEFKADNISRQQAEAKGLEEQPEQQREAGTLLGSEKLFNIASDPKTAITLGFMILSLITFGGTALAGGGAAAAGAATGGRAVITRTAFQGGRSIFTQRAFTGAATKAGINKLFTETGKQAALKGLSKIGITGTKKLLLKRTAQVGTAAISTGVLMTWLASDNILSGTSIYARDVGNLVNDGIISPEEGMEYLNELEGWQNVARGTVQFQAKYNPLMRPFADPLIANGELGKTALELQRRKITNTVGGGNQ